MASYELCSPTRSIPDSKKRMQGVSRHRTSSIMKRRGDWKERERERGNTEIITDHQTDMSRIEDASRSGTPKFPQSSQQTSYSNPQSWQGLVCHITKLAIGKPMARFAPAESTPVQNTTIPGFRTCFYSLLRCGNKWKNTQNNLSDFYQCIVKRTQSELDLAVYLIPDCSRSLRGKMGELRIVWLCNLRFDVDLKSPRFLPMNFDSFPERRPDMSKSSFQQGLYVDGSTHRLVYLVVQQNCVKQKPSMVTFTKRKRLHALRFFFWSDRYIAHIYIYI